MEIFFFTVAPLIKLFNQIIANRYLSYAGLTGPPKTGLVRGLTINKINLYFPPTSSSPGRRRWRKVLGLRRIALKFGAISIIIGKPG
jgi:hypothetical protein